MLAELRHFWDLDDDLLTMPGRAPGWSYTDAAVLQRAGDISEGFATVLPRLLPLLDGLSNRLQTPGAAFLDVGTGVAKLALAMARVWPSLAVVGIDVWPPALAIARANIEEAGLQNRVEVREQPCEQLTDEAMYDLAWLPAPFVPKHSLGNLSERVHGALKPGGWLLCAAAKPGDDLRGAALRFRVQLYGGEPSAQTEIENLLSAKSFINVRTLPGPPRDYKIIVAGQRPM
ncbi:MAG: class I SAM-dependent methyltransferase [Vicinamibacterales bacterium]